MPENAPRRPVAPAAPCRAVAHCPAATRDAATMPRDGVERIVMTVLRFLAAARETGDAACWDEALDRAEAAFGARDGALLVARAATLLRCLARDDGTVRFLPPPCRRLSPGEAGILAGLRARFGGRHAEQHLPPTLSPTISSALSDVVEPLRAGVGIDVARAATSTWRPPLPDTADAV